MAKVVWANAAYLDLYEITEYIAFDNPEAASRLARRVLGRVRQLRRHPESGSIPDELEGHDIRQLIEPPCRIFYRFDGKTARIVRVLRSERLLRLNAFDLSD
jgi:toxin ParE1/3/4